MTKPHDEIPTPYAGQTRTDHTLIGTDHTPFAKTAEFEKVLAEMSERLHYSQNVFKLGYVQREGTGETEAIVVTVWHDNFKMKITAATKDPVAFAESLEAALKEYDKYKDRFGDTGDTGDDTSHSDTGEDTGDTGEDTGDTGDDQPHKI